MKKEKKKINEQSNIINNFNSNLEKIKNDDNLIIKSLEEKIINQNDKIKSNEQIIKQLEFEKEEVTKNFSKEIEDLKNENKKLTDKQNEIINLKKKLENDKELLESKYREEMDRNNFKHTLEMNEIQIKLDSQISQLKIENLQLKDNYEKLISKSKILINSNNKLDKEIINKKIGENSKSEFINYQNNISEPNKLILFTNNSNTNPLTKRNSKKLTPMKPTSLSSVKLSKITINAKKKSN